MLRNFLEEVSIPWPGWGEEVSWFVFRDDGKFGVWGGCWGEVVFLVASTV